MRTLLTKFLLSSAFSMILWTGAMAQSHLDAYIQEGIRNNIVLQQKHVGLDKAMLSLKTARGMFMPSVNIIGAYTSGEGGRNISIPVGDLLNPVYATLNQLTDSNLFPQIENVSTNFFPHNFYDAKVRTSMPLFNTDLIYNQKIQQQQVVLQSFEQDIYKRELIKNIKVAYFNYLSAKEAIGIYATALTRAEEGKRVNESLLTNGKGLPAYVLRAQSEVNATQAQIIAAEKQADNAQLYFNFLLNRDGSTPILTDDLNTTPYVDEIINGSFELSKREELRQLKEYQNLNQTIVKMNQRFWAPRLSGFVDLGSQYTNWEFNRQSRYYLVGVQLDMPLFAGFTNRNKIHMAELNEKSATLNLSLVSQQLDMSARMARNSVITSYSAYQSAQKQLEAAESYQRLIQKGFQEGANTFIETVDARAQLTAAQLQKTITLYQVLIASAGYERETGAYTLPQ